MPYGEDVNKFGGMFFLLTVQIQTLLSIQLRKPMPILEFLLSTGFIWQILYSSGWHLFWNHKNCV